MGKSESCSMTAMSGAFNKLVFDGNTILPQKSEENKKRRYFYLGGNVVCSFPTNDKIFIYTSQIWVIIYYHIV